MRAKIEVVEPTQIVAKTAEVLMRLAKAIEDGGTDVERIAESAADELRLFLEPFEAAILIARLTEERRRCALCGKAAAASRCIDALCLWCDRKEHLAARGAGR